jgi:phage shock protein PspC (stress-responsive transcriptional regulator)
MNKTVTAAIGGINFYLEESAFEKFRAYLDSVRRSLAGTEGREEILQDIEARIAELLKEMIGHEWQVVTDKQVEAVIAAMGKPEDFTAGETSSPDFSVPVSRKLFRDPDDKVLGGVCSGIGAYFGIDAIWLRLFFAFLFFGFGTGLLLYIILWIVIPKALTTADKLRMRGEPVNLSTIERNLREEMDQVRQRASEMAATGKVRGESFFRRVIAGIVDLLGYGLKVAAKLIAFFFLCIGLVVSFALFVALMAAVLHVPGIDLPLPLDAFLSEDTWLIWAALGAALALGIPFLALAWAGAKILFNVRLPRVVGYMALGLWVVGVCLAAWLGIRTAGQFKEEGSVRTEKVLATPSSGILVLSSPEGQKEYDKYGDNKKDEDEWGFVTEDGKLRINNVHLDIVRSPDDRFHIIQLQYARGTDPEGGRNAASRIAYGFMQRDSLLTVDRTLTLPAGESFRNQRVQLVLQVPVDGKVVIDPSMEGVIYDVSNLQNIYDKDMVGRSWGMTVAGLTCLDCDGKESTVGGEAFDIQVDGGSLNADSSGIRIKGRKGAEVVIDSNGIRVSEK